MKKIGKIRELNSFLFLAGLIFLVGLVNRSFWQPAAYGTALMTALYLPFCRQELPLLS